MSKELKKIKNEFEIVDITDEKKITITKEKERIIIYDKKLTTNLFERKFMDEYKRLLYILNDLLNDTDNTGSDIELVKYDIDNLRRILINKYGKYLTKDILQKYLKMLQILDGKLSLVPCNIKSNGHSR